MSERASIYEHAVLSAHTRRLLAVVLAAFALVLSTMGVAHAAIITGISGTITGEGGVPLQTVYVEAWDPETDAWAYDVTNASGFYELDVPAGAYYLAFSPMNPQYQWEYYDEAHDLDNATLVTVTGGQVVQLDEELARSASISGSVTRGLGDPRSRAVAVIDAGTGDLMDRVSLDEDGDYSVTGLPAGTYKLSFNRLSGFAYSAPEFWEDNSEGSGLAAADPITLGAGEERTGVDATLVEGGHVTGRLIDAYGQPLDCRLQAFTDDATLVTRNGRTEADGTFDLTGLSTGSYLIRAVPGGDCRNGIQFVPSGGGQLVRSIVSAGPIATTLGGTVAIQNTLVYDVGERPVVNTGSPWIGGTAQVGQTLTASPGSWNRTSLSFTYRWHSGGKVWQDSANPQLVVPEGAVNLPIAVTVTATRFGYTPGAATSPATGLVQPGKLVVVQAPKLKGKARVGKRLKVDLGSVSPSATGFRFVWKRGHKSLNNVDGRTYKLRPGDVGSKIKVIVSYLRPGWDSVRVKTRPSPAVQA